eukprot:5959951-Pleurochrysis_carterae.AAC.1
MSSGMKIRSSNEKKRELDAQSCSSSRVRGRWRIGGSAVPLAGSNERADRHSSQPGSVACGAAACCVSEACAESAVEATLERTPLGSATHERSSSCVR